MKVAICLIACSFVAVASAGHLVGHAPLYNTGSSHQYRTQDNLGQYSFGYDESGATGGTFRHEKSDAYGNRVGSYGLTGADGRVRIVNYVADDLGYRANVQTNEPGTESRDTAAVVVNKPNAPYVAAPVALPYGAEAAPVALPYAAAPAPYAAAPTLPLAAPLAAGYQGPLAYPPTAPALYGAHHQVINHQHLAAPLAAY